jgi:3-oxoacyl-(acyl-carrier-protein) synthase III
MRRLDVRKPSAVITGLGHFLPGRLISSREVEDRVKANGGKIPAGLIKRLAGVVTRYYAGEGVSSSDLAAQAGLRALANAQVEPSSVDLLIFASATHDMAEPATANPVQEKIGCWGAQLFDVKNACNSFINALEIAHSFIETGRASKVLVTAGEVLSAVINWEVEDAEDLRYKFAGFTLGDGGGACLLESGPAGPRGLIPGKYLSDGRYWRLSTVLSGGTMLRRDLSRWFFECHTEELQALALERLPPLINQVLEEVNWTPSEVKLVVPHQVSMPVIRKLCILFDYPLERCVVTVDRLGNLAAASIPVALSLAAEEGRLELGDKVLLIGAAAGFSAGVMPLVW